MKLFYSETSPYSRKVRMLIHEKGLASRIEAIVCNPFAEAPELLAENPLGKVPTLVLEDGMALYDSPVICACLDSLDEDTRLIPEAGTARWQVLRREALCDGILDAAYNIVMERRRDVREQSPGWISEWQGQIERALQQLDDELAGAARLDDEIALDDIAQGAALGYLAFRLPELDWRGRHPRLARWYDAFSERESMRATRPA